MNTSDDHPDPVGGDLVERYLQRRMSAAEEAAFEEFLLENPAAAAAVEDAERLQRGLRGLAADSLLAEKVAAPNLAAPSVAKTARPAGFRRWAPPLAAAALLAVALFPWWLAERRAGRLENELALAEALAAAPPTRTTLLQLGVFRGGSDDGLPVLTLGEPGELFVFICEPAEKGAADYRAELRQAEKVLWSAGGLATDARGQLVLSLPARLVPAGVAELVLTARRPGEPPRPAGSFRWRAVAP